MYGRGVALVVVLLAVMVAAGCTGGAPVAESEAQGTEGSVVVTPPIVVALIDSGINPYHVAFATAAGKGIEAYAETFGAEIIGLAGRGGLEQRLEADAGMWESLEEGRLYAFAGTRVLAISFGQTTSDAPVFDVVGHGTRTSSVIAREAPEALIVMVQIDVQNCVPDCPPVPVAAAAMAWIAQQPWIDIVSMSIGTPGNPPHVLAADAEAAGFVEASKTAHDAGKLIVSGAGNTITPPVQSHFQGLPWLVAVGGAQANPRGEATLAARGVDVVANYTTWTADAGTLDGMEWASGTSYAAPQVAGVAANAAGVIRTAGRDDVRPSSLRPILNATARYFLPTDWDPRNEQANETEANLASTTIPVLLPFAQMGWGYVDGSMASEITRRVLEDDFSIPPEKAQTAEYMAQYQAVREAYWQNAP